MNIIEISNKFPTELDAIKYIEGIRWHKGRKCAYCNSDKLGSKRQGDYRYHCYNCHKSFSVTTGTKLHGTGTPLKKWLYAFSLMSDATKAMSAKQLQRNLDISYPTAHSMHRKIRLLMIELYKDDMFIALVRNSMKPKKELYVRSPYPDIPFLPASLVMVNPTIE